MDDNHDSIWINEETSGDPTDCWENTDPNTSLPKYFVLGPPSPNQEDGQIVGFGSIHLASPLAFDHSAGEQVGKVAVPLNAAPNAVGGIVEMTTQPDGRNHKHVLVGLGGSSLRNGRCRHRLASAAI